MNEITYADDLVLFANNKQELEWKRKKWKKF